MGVTIDIGWLVRRFMNEWFHLDWHKTFMCTVLVEDLLQVCTILDATVLLA